MADDFNRDYQAGKSGQTHYQPTNYSDYQRGVADREGANKNPLSGWSNGGGGGGGGGAGVFILGPLLLGIVFYVLAAVLLVVPLLIVIFAFAVVFYPIAGAIALVVGFLIKEVFIGDGVRSVYIVWISLAPCFATLVLATKMVERRAEQNDRYRRSRHWIRVVGFGLLSTEVALPFLAPYVVGHNLAWGLEIYLVRGWSLLNGITIAKLAVIAATMVATHFGLRWWERRRVASRYR